MDTSKEELNVNLRTNFNKTEEPDGPNGVVNGIAAEGLLNGHSTETPPVVRNGDMINGMHTPEPEQDVTASAATATIPDLVQDDQKPATMDVESMVSVQAGKGMQYLDGPDQVVPSIELSTTVPNGRIELAIGTSAIGARDPISVPGLLRRAAETFPEVDALAYKDENGKWNKLNFRDYEKNVKTVAKAFLTLGLQKHHAVCILGFNSPQWFVADLAAIYAGGFAAGIYTTNSPSACFHCADSSQANIIVVEDHKQLQKILEIKDRLPHLKAIIQYCGKVEVDGVYSWDQVMDIGRKETDDQLERVMKSIVINECCTLVFTSGTVGAPKAVMLSHDNLTWTSYCVAASLDLKVGGEVIVSYLPLSHVAAQVLDIFVTMWFGITVYFADKDALKGSLVTTLQEARPTHFLGVPRVWEKISEKMQLVGNQAGGVRKAIASWAKGHGLQQNMNRMNGINSRSLGYTIASLLIFRRIKQALGLDRCRNFFSAAAPLSIDVKKYFMSLDIPIMEVFGMSESSGPHTIAFVDNFKLDSIGRTLPGLQTIIHNPDTNGEGEICMAGRNVFMGYLNDSEKTREAIDDKGQLHSGDIGKLDDDGFVYITGRIKELIITAGGENIPPVLIEQILMKELPCLSNAMLIGDRRKFLSILLSMKTEMNPETGEPLDELSPTAKMWCKSVGSSAETVSDILKGPDRLVMAAIQKGIDCLNEQAISNAQKVQKFSLLPKDFSITTGELGPTMKVKRNVVANKYSDIIEKFYEEDA